MAYERLCERHLPLVDAFHCVETEEELARFKSEDRRRIRLHSQEMEDFLKTEAYGEQELGMNTTWLLLDEDERAVLAYVSLCSDAISLEFEEQTQAGLTYRSAPALKIARLAVDVTVRGRGIGRQMIEFSAYQAQLIREHAGIFFLTLDCYAHRLSFYEGVGFVKNLIQPVVLPYDSPISMRLSLDRYLERIAQCDSEQED